MVIGIIRYVMVVVFVIVTDSGDLVALYQAYGKIPGVWRQYLMKNNKWRRRQSAW